MPNSRKDRFFKGDDKTVGASIARPRTANGSPYFLILLIFFHVDYLPEQTIVRHCFVLLIRRGETVLNSFGRTE